MANVGNDEHVPVRFALRMPCMKISVLSDVLQPLSLSTMSWTIGSYRRIVPDVKPRAKDVFHGVNAEHVLGVVELRRLELE